jgi:hypothetical protein
VGGFDSGAIGLEGACDPLRVPSFASKMAFGSASVRVRLKISVSGCYGNAAGALSKGYMSEALHVACDRRQIFNDRSSMPSPCSN